MVTAPAKTAKPSKAAKSAARAAGAKKAPASKSTAKSAPANKANGGKRPAAPRKAAAPKPVKHCLHGCGAQTKGGDFVIGHDAKLKSILQKAYVAGESTVSLGDSPLSGQAPMTIAKQRGWESFLDKAKQAADDKAKRKSERPASKRGGPKEVGAKVSFSYRGKKRTGVIAEVAGERARVEFEMDIDGVKTKEDRAFGLESLTRVG